MTQERGGPCQAVAFALGALANDPLLRRAVAHELERGPDAYDAIRPLHSCINLGLGAPPSWDEGLIAIHLFQPMVFEGHRKGWGPLSKTSLKQLSKRCFSHVEMTSCDVPWSHFELSPYVVDPAHQGAWSGPSGFLDFIDGLENGNHVPMIHSAPWAASADSDIFPCLGVTRIFITPESLAMWLGPEFFYNSPGAAIPEFTPGLLYPNDRHPNSGYRLLDVSSGRQAFHSASMQSLDWAIVRIADSLGAERDAAGRFLITREPTGQGIALDCGGDLLAVTLGFDLPQPFALFIGQGEKFCFASVGNPDVGCRSQAPTIFSTNACPASDA